MSLQLTHQHARAMVHHLLPITKVWGLTPFSLEKTCVSEPRQCSPVPVSMWTSIFQRVSSARALTLSRFSFFFPLQMPLINLSKIYRYWKKSLLALTFQETPHNLVLCCVFLNLFHINHIKIPMAWYSRSATEVFLLSAMKNNSTIKADCLLYYRPSNTCMSLYVPSETSLGIRERSWPWIHSHTTSFPTAKITSEITLEKNRTCL